jgi:hypothetical protein
MRHVIQFPIERRLSRVKMLPAVDLFTEREIVARYDFGLPVR